jgi:hypothetical protein
MDAGGVQIVFCTVAAVAEGEVAADRPADANFDECLMKLRARVGEIEGWYVPHSWVTNDVSLHRGILQGFPKRLGRVALTRFRTLQPRAGGRRAGARLGATLQAPEGLHLHAMHECAERDSSAIGVTLPFLLLRSFPSLPGTAGPTVEEIVSPVITDASEEEVWSGPASIVARGAGPLGPLLDPLEPPKSRSFRTAFTITGTRSITGYS